MVVHLMLVPFILRAWARVSLCVCGVVSLRRARARRFLSGSPLPTVDIACTISIQCYATVLLSRSRKHERQSQQLQQMQNNAEKWNHRRNKSDEWSGENGATTNCGWQTKRKAAQLRKLGDKWRQRQNQQARLCIKEMNAPHEVWGNGSSRAYARPRNELQHNETRI